MSIRHSGWVDVRERLTWLPAAYRPVSELQSGGEEWRPPTDPVDRGAVELEAVQTTSRKAASCQRRRVAVFGYVHSADLFRGLVASRAGTVRASDRREALKPYL